MLLTVNLDLQRIVTQPLVTEFLSEVRHPQSAQQPIAVQFVKGSAVVDPELLQANVLTSSADTASVITTDAPHGFSTGDSVTIAGHTGSPKTISTSAISKLTVTVTIASPGVFTTSATHFLAAGQAVTLSTNGSLPTGLTAGITYYVIAAGLTSTNFELSATLGGSAINTSVSQTGIHQVNLPYTVITATAHGFSNSDTVIISGHVGSIPAIDGTYSISGSTTNTFTIPLAITTAGAGGTVEKSTSTPDINGVHTITVTGLYTFTVPVTVTTAGIGGTASTTTPMLLRWEVKEVDKFDQTPPMALISPGDFVKTGSGTNTLFTGKCNYVTEAINAALGIDPIIDVPVTISVASPAVVSATGHGLVADQTVVFATTGALPTGLISGLEYFVLAAGLGADNFEVSATLGGSPVNTSGTQSGTHNVFGYITSNDKEQLALMGELSWAGPYPGVAEWVSVIIRNVLHREDITPVSTVGASGITAISMGSNTLTVTFDTPLASTPKIRTAIVQKAGGDDSIWLTDISDISSTGFIAYFSAAATTSNYTLSWEVTL